MKHIELLFCGAYVKMTGTAAADANVFYTESEQFEGLGLKQWKIE